MKDSTNNMTINASASQAHLSPKTFATATDSEGDIDTLIEAETEEEKAFLEKYFAATKESDNKSITVATLNSRKRRMTTVLEAQQRLKK